jgi:hypothetical protein
MFDYVIQNFNLMSFSIGMAVFLIVTSITRLIASYLAMVRAKKQAREVEGRFGVWKEKLAAKNKEIAAKIDELEKGAK